ncbi:MAG: phosphate ABC transporter permease PstA [Leptospiraceae bacterium]|nr:phosphate ABC transporter permease PstA [Leptospiraceae bacterium]MCP5493620.1 phosphate ABC transporter permease PstA [Leptospiraceae bacterium]
MNPIKVRKLKSLFVLSLSSLTTAIGLFWLVFILSDVIVHGVQAINLDLFLNDPVALGAEGGGLRNAFVGQLLIIVAATSIGVPLGLLGGIFLAEYVRGTKYAHLISMLADIMVSVPSIVIGTFAYAMLVKPFGVFNGWAGSIALAIIMIPVILRTTEEMLKLVPTALREAAFALGASRFQVAFQVVFKAAINGILTGVLLAIARVSGETAPLLFTSFNNNFFSLDMNGPISSLTVTIYQYAMGPYKEWHRQAWAASLIIMLVILLITIIARLAFKKDYKY